MLILGGTGFLSRDIALEAVELGHNVTCLTRGISGEPPPGAEHVVADREEPDAYAEIADRYWDEIVDITSTPSYARAALEVLGQNTGHWTYVSSVSVYLHGDNTGSEGDPIHQPLPQDADESDMELYGEMKAASELAARTAVGDRLLVARAGLLVGPGDHTDRFGYWPARFARGGDVLVPDIPDAPSQVLDARDLAAWIVDAAGRGDVGTFDAVGPVMRFADMLSTCAEATGFDGKVYAATPQWLTEHDVAHWAGPESLPLWLPPELASMTARSGALAAGAGLERRPLTETVGDVLHYEHQMGLERPRLAGLSPHREGELLADLLAG